MLNLTVPALIKIREGITINLSLSVSQAVETDVPQYKVKEGIDNPTKQEDYELNGTANVITFWFIDAKALTYRVGEEITQEDFDRISTALQQLNYIIK